MTVAPSGDLRFRHARGALRTYVYWPRPFAAATTTSDEWWLLVFAPSIAWRLTRREPEPEPAMNQARLDSNSDLKAGRKNLRPAFTIAAGLIALAVATAAVLEQPGGRASAVSDPAAASFVPLAAAPAEDQTAIANTTSAPDAARPRFQRSDEPALEDSTNPHGG
jgi:hypothetical protein